MSIIVFFVLSDFSWLLKLDVLFCQFINGGLWVYRLEATELDELDKQTDGLTLL